MKKPNEASEHQIQQAILDALPYYGIYAWRQNAGMIPVGYGEKRRYIKVGQAGLPDIIGVKRENGQLIGIEVKRPSGKVTPLQEATMERLREHGALVFVARSLDDLKKYLKESK